MYYRKEYTKVQGLVYLNQNLCITITMKCIIPGRHTKVFGKAVHSLSRIGNELWFDPVEKGLALRVVNSSRSAYACIFFSPLFFHKYHRTAFLEQAAGCTQLNFKCKFSVKSVLPVFRSLSTLEKNVDKCTIYANINDGYMNFQLFYKNGLTKTYQLAYEDCEPLQAVFANNTCPNVLRIQPRVLSDVVVHFPTCQEEITLCVTPLRVSFKTYCEEAFEFSKSVHTEMHLSPEEFHYFQIGVDSEVTFCLKELRGFLAFADTTSSYISLYFSKPGKPVAFSMDNMFFEANLILATLAETEMRNSSQISKSNIAGSKLCSPPPATELSNATSVAENLASQHIISLPQAENQSPMISNSTLLTACGNAKEDHPDMVEETPTHSSYSKFCTLFFGAVSSETHENADGTFCSLATASEDEDEDFCSRKLSQTF
ncbi:cell cycle checkpoint control protein RAD9B isoform X1 [Xenopus laevis]|uniref:Cell cycle checkpoint control protein n=1 Tax=Xenopus laevis TaxID=8355 RepID=A0A8J0T8N3_XENLA|nr:cell cycle checkpoint control protein RAD9B isoform X1 [Xenopus laevis]